MGILKLMDFLKAKFPKCIKDVLATDLSGKTIAIDASNVIYQFLVQTQGNLKGMKSLQLEIILICQQIFMEIKQDILWGLWQEYLFIKKTILKQYGFLMVNHQHKSLIN